MDQKKSNLKLSIWGLALGYFAFYVPYGSLTKAMSKGIVPGMSEAVSGFQMLPTVIFGTILGFATILLLTGWWKSAGRVKVFNLRIPFASNKFTFFSGIATATIIVTTTLAYSFTGISIVFAACSSAPKYPGGRVSARTAPIKWKVTIKTRRVIKKICLRFAILSPVRFREM